MPYNTKLANRIRQYLTMFPGLKIEEKKMFSGITFMVNGKMCISVSGEKLMCRFDPDTQEEIAEKNGFEPMIMKGKEYKGYCYIDAETCTSDQELEYWINLCLKFNERAKSSKKINRIQKKRKAN